MARRALREQLFYFALVPAIVLAAPLNQVALQNRYSNVLFWPVKSWSSLWQWRVRSDAALPRDR